MAYDPPKTTNLPFNFTGTGYSKPNTTELLFNFAESAKFGTLRAAVTAMQAPDYLNQTYTYTKSCPSYVVGYGPGGVQVIQGRCLYGGIRDLRATLTVITPQAIPADLPASITGLITKDLQAVLDTHTPRDLSAWVKVRYRVQQDLTANVMGYATKDLVGILSGTHDPVDLPAYLNARERNLSDLIAAIRGWGASDLPAYLKALQYTNLPAYLQAIEPGDLPAYIKVWPQRYLPASTHGWGALDLGAYLNMVFANDMPASIVGRDDMFSNLQARLKGYGSEYRDLPAYLQSLHTSDLSAILRAKYFAGLPGYLFPVLPIDLPALLHAWHARDLQGIITGTRYPWELSANIVGVGGYLELSAFIYALQGAQNIGALPARVAVWQPANLPAYIAADVAPYLSAYLNPVGYASNLHASIYPKVVRLTTVVSISTMAHYDLSAMINSPCFYTSYNNLSAYIYPKFKGDLFAFIRAIIYNYKPANLGAKVGYADAYSEVDTLTLNFNILPNSFYTLDKYRLVINLFSAGNTLSAYIRGTLRYTDLLAQLTAVEIDTYTYSEVFKNRERVIQRTYDGVFKAFETVEMAFKSAVKDYFYSSDGDYTWKKDRLERWMLSVQSMLPADTALRLKRRLHRAATVYDLRRFVSVDEAVRFAIAYVTEYPQADLGAQIVNRGTFGQLGGTINPRYVKSSRGTLPVTINPVGHTVVFGTDQNISKI